MLDFQGQGVRILYPGSMYRQENTQMTFHVQSVSVAIHQLDARAIRKCHSKEKE